MNKTEWHEARRRRHAAMAALWGGESPALREATKGTLVPGNRAERMRNLRWSHLNRALSHPGSRISALALVRSLRGGLSL